MMKNSFLLYYDFEDTVDLLTDEELGQIIRALFAYEKRGEVAQFDDRMLTSAFKNVCTGLDRNKEKYSQICRKRKEAAGQRWNKQKDANECNCIEANANA